MEAPGAPRSAGVSSNCAWMPSARRIPGIRPTIAARTMGTQGVSIEMNSHTLTTAAGMSRCSQRVYVTERVNGRRKWCMPPSCQWAEHANSPERGR